VKRWFPQVVRAGPLGNADLVVALQAVDAYTEQYPDARKDLRGDGRIEVLASKLPGLTEQRWAQLQDLNAIVEYLGNRERKCHIDKTKFYMEGYQRTLTYAQAKDYAETTEEVQTVRVVLQQVGSIKDLYMGLFKGLDAMNFQISNVTKLRVAGVEDAHIVYRPEH
jgi:hypothetical protein